MSDEHKDKTYREVMTDMLEESMKIYQPGMLQALERISELFVSTVSKKMLTDDNLLVTISLGFTDDSLIVTGETEAIVLGEELKRKSTDVGWYEYLIGHPPLSLVELRGALIAFQAGLQNNSVSTDTRETLFTVLSVMCTLLDLIIERNT